jgi:DNA-binding response OmpR family regulator
MAAAYGPEHDAAPVRRSTEGTMRVLIVEDDTALAATVRAVLEAHGVEVQLAHDRDAAWQLAWREPFDVAVLDVMLPGDDEAGFALADDLRAAGFRQPLLFLSARDAVPDRVRGLRVGDDYLPKPFAVDELLARLHALYRRGDGRPEVLRWRDVAVRPTERRVTRGGADVRLTSKEFDVLLTLLQHPGRVFTRADLMDRVWGLGSEHASNVVDVYVRNLRVKLDEGIVETIRGVGYRAAATDGDA